MIRHLLVIGAQRCGTTYLHTLLDAHPQITMARPANPEPKVFISDEATGKGLILQESGCGKIAHEKVATFEKINATTLEISDGRRFQAIRYKKRPDETASN